MNFRKSTTVIQELAVFVFKSHGDGEPLKTLKTGAVVLPGCHVFAGSALSFRLHEAVCTGSSCFQLLPASVR